MANDSVSPSLHWTRWNRTHRESVQSGLRVFFWTRWFWSGITTTLVCPVGFGELMKRHSVYAWCDQVLPRTHHFLSCRDVTFSLLSKWNKCSGAWCRDSGCRSNARSNLPASVRTGALPLQTLLWRHTCAHTRGRNRSGKTSHAETKVAGLGVLFNRSVYKSVVRLISLKRRVTKGRRSVFKVKTRKGVGRSLHMFFWIRYLSSRSLTKLLNLPLERMPSDWVTDPRWTQSG